MPEETEELGASPDSEATAPNDAAPAAGSDSPAPDTIVSNAPAALDPWAELTTETGLTPNDPAWNIKANKHLRVQLDAVLQSLKALPMSDERKEAAHYLTNSIMWIGMDQKRLNNPTPYPESYNPDNAIVHPPADGLKM